MTKWLTIVHCQPLARTAAAPERYSTCPQSHQSAAHSQLQRATWAVARTFRVRFPDKLQNLRMLESSAELGTESESAPWDLSLSGGGPTPTKLLLP